MFGALIARLDPTGHALANQLKRSIEQLDWSHVRWLVETELHGFVLIDHDTRRASIHAVRDMDDWASDVSVWVRVEAIVAGRRLPTPFAHRALAKRDGEDLPDRRPASSPVELRSLAD